MEPNRDKENPEQPLPDREKPDLVPEDGQNTTDADQTGSEQDDSPDRPRDDGQPAPPPPDASPEPANSKKSILPVYSRRELAWLGALGIALLLIFILSLRLFFRDVNTTTPDEVNFPVEGTNVVVKKAETFWRKVDREKDSGVQLTTQFIPAADITLKSSKSGSLRFFFESPEGERVGDPVTLTFSNGKFDGSGDAAASIHATGGLEDLGDYNEYLTEKVHFWYLIITEGAGLEAEGSSYEQIIRMPISPKRR